MSNKFNPENFQSAFLEIYKSLGNQSLSLMNLNVQAMEKMAKLNGFKDFTEAKKPTDITEAQVKMFSDVGKEVSSYNQNVLDLVQQTQSEVTRQMTELGKTFTDKDSSGGGSGKKAA